MDSYCVKCKTKTMFSEDPQLFRTKNNRLLMKGPCGVCNKTKTIFISQKQGERLLGSLFKLPGNKIPVLGDVPLIGKLLF
jgi:hypothetical protein